MSLLQIFNFCCIFLQPPTIPVFQIRISNINPTFGFLSFKFNMIRDFFISFRSDIFQFKDTLNYMDQFYKDDILVLSNNNNSMCFQILEFCKAYVQFHASLSFHGTNIGKIHSLFLNIKLIRNIIRTNINILALKCG